MKPGMPVDVTRLPRGMYRARCAMVAANGFGRTVEQALDDLMRVLLLRDRAKQQLARQAWRPEDVADTVTQAQLGAPYVRLAPGPQPRALTACKFRLKAATHSDLMSAAIPI